MAFLTVSADSAIHYHYSAPQDQKPTFVFQNSNGASTKTWEAIIGPKLRSMGFGTLSMDFRGQGQSKYGPTATLLPDEIVSDINSVMSEVRPPNPIYVGLSIGGLHGMRSYQESRTAIGMILINVLRRPGLRVSWLNEVEDRLLSLGGMSLVKDAFRPMVCGPKELEILRPERLLPEPYAGWPEDNPRRRLTRGVKRANWDFPYEELDLPVLVLSGLQDRLYYVRSDVEEMVVRMPDARVVEFPDSGHSLQDEEPEKLVDEIASFAKRIM